MEDEERILKILKEIIEDKKNGEKYWFDSVAYRDARDCPMLTNRDICIKLEVNTGIKIASDEALMKHVRRFNNYVDGCKNGVLGDFEFIKMLGVALSEDDMAFLIPITMESFNKIVNSIRGQFNVKDANKIYNQLNQVLYLLEVSCYFNYIPSTEEDGERHFGKLMLDIKKDVDRIFSDEQIARKRLYELIDEVDFIINSCEVPGVPDNWLKLNPNLNYFNCVYEIIEENPEMYDSIKEGYFNDFRRRFSFLPSIKEIKERQDYFDKKRRKYPTRTDERFYQDELIETLNMRFNECIAMIKEEEKWYRSK